MDRGPIISQAPHAVVWVEKSSRHAAGAPRSEHPACSQKEAERLLAETPDVYRDLLGLFEPVLIRPPSDLWRQILEINLLAVEQAHDGALEVLHRRANSLRKIREEFDL
jgi:hypothetical protein